MSSWYCAVSSATVSVRFSPAGGCHSSRFTRPVKSFISRPLHKNGMHAHMSGTILGQCIKCDLQVDSRSSAAVPGALIRFWMSHSEPSAMQWIMQSNLEQVLTSNSDVSTCRTTLHH